MRLPRYLGVVIAVLGFALFRFGRSIFLQWNTLQQQDVVNSAVYHKLYES